MMKLSRAILVFYLLLVCVGCSSAPRDIFFDGKLFSPDEDYESGSMYYRVNSNTITNGEATFIYVVKKDGYVEVTYDNKKYIVSGTTNHLEVEYPDGETYFYNVQTSDVTTVTSGSGSPEGYPELEDFSVFVNLRNGNSSGGSGEGWIGLLLIVFGVIGATNPRISFYLNRGWRYRNAEPSDLYLGLARAGGFITIVVGVLMLMSSCSS